MFHFSGFILVLLFVTQLILSYFISQRLISSLQQFFFYITHSKKWTVIFVAWILMPGTIIHELSHLVIARLLWVKTGKIELATEVIDDGIKLGSIQINQTGPIRRSLIGFAPFLCGVALISALLWFFPFKSYSYQAFIIGFLVFEVANTMFSSKKDLEGFFKVFLILVLVVTFWIFLLRAFRVSLPSGWLTNLLNSPSTTNLIWQLLIFFGIVMGINLAILVFLRLGNGLLSKVLGSRD